MESQNTTGQKPFIAAADSDSTRLVRSTDSLSGMNSVAGTQTGSLTGESFADIKIKAGTLIGGAYKLLSCSAKISPSNF